MAIMTPTTNATIGASNMPIKEIVNDSLVLVPASIPAKIYKYESYYQFQIVGKSTTDYYIRILILIFLSHNNMVIIFIKLINSLPICICHSQVIHLYVPFLPVTLSDTCVVNSSVIILGTDEITRLWYVPATCPAILIQVRTIYIASLID